MIIHSLTLLLYFLKLDRKTVNKFWSFFFSIVVSATCEDQNIDDCPQMAKSIIFRILRIKNCSPLQLFCWIFHCLCHAFASLSLLLLNLSLCLSLWGPVGKGRADLNSRNSCLVLQTDTHKHTLIVCTHKPIWSDCCVFVWSAWPYMSVCLRVSRTYCSLCTRLLCTGNHQIISGLTVVPH